MKIMVVDTVGGNRFSDKYKSFFPNATLRGLEMKDYGDCNPHGYQCGYYAGVLTALIDEPCEIVFARIFDGQGNPIPYSNEWLIDQIIEERPAVISNSWGQWDGDNKFSTMMGASSWREWANEYALMLETLGSVSFHAAGNDDSNDMDEDVDFPQRLIADEVIVVGSHNRAGVPSVYSGDGSVLITMWGEKVALLDGLGRWGRGSGTSFACPKAAGLCAALRYNDMKFRQYAMAHADRDDSWRGVIPHPKWGYGSLEQKFQFKLASLPEDLQPPFIPLSQKVNEYKRLELLSEAA